MELEIRAPNFGSIGHRVTCMEPSPLPTKSARKQLSPTKFIGLSKRRERSRTTEANCLVS